MKKLFNHQILLTISTAIVFFGEMVISTEALAETINASDSSDPSSIDLLLQNLDGDGDRVPNSEDHCPHTPNGLSVWTKSNMISNGGNSIYVGCGAGENAQAGIPKQPNSMFEKVESIYNSAGQSPSWEELEGWYVGRCYWQGEPSTSISTLISSAERNVDGPLFPARKILFDQYDFAPNKFDEISSEHAQVLRKKLAESPLSDFYQLQTSATSILGEQKLKSEILPDEPAPEFYMSEPVRSDWGSDEAFRYAHDTWETLKKRWDDRHSTRYFKDGFVRFKLEVKKYEAYLVSKKTVLEVFHSNMSLPPRESDQVQMFCYYFRKVGP